MNVTAKAQLWKRLPAPLYKLAAQTWIDRTYPRHLFIETTSACNLTCAYCPRESIKHHMDFSLFRSVVDEATQYGARSFSLHLFGEPTLYPHCWDAIGYIKKAHSKHTVLLTTNGTTLNARVDDLLAANPDHVFWTWRPEAVFTPATKEKLRRWGKFRVRFIQEVTPPDAYAEWANWPNVEGRNLHNYGGTIDLKRWSPIQQKDGLSKDAQSVEPRRWPCYHLWLAPAVAWNGHILLCCADPHHKEVLGTFPQMTVAQAWRSDRMQAIRQGHLGGEYKGICANCDVWKQYPDLFFSWQKKKPV